MLPCQDCYAVPGAGVTPGGAPGRDYASSVALPNVERQAASVLRELERRGVLLETDGQLPSLVAHVAGGPVQGSWWGHPLGHTIFAIGEILFQNPDVLLAKLISGKATWIHRRLWPPLLAVALSREAWQMEPLSREARILLGEVDRDGEARATGPPGARARGPPPRPG